MTVAQLIIELKKVDQNLIVEIQYEDAFENVISEEIVDTALTFDGKDKFTIFI